ncbi:palmitoyltransferase ZDHHC3 [Phodopus roborovskii]|uniref:Palmitoyltransferase n=1 Tax=Phodopus roborovskii TaxID=109678 RepID=A0AAU9ZHX6_PHORO|nr:palmitoyltransferase ZDHHC3 [Phodopus roborovskii]CAH6791313.1 Zdhhc25 [Phodopus roborovskii]
MLSWVQKRGTSEHRTGLETPLQGPKQRCWFVWDPMGIIFAIATWALVLSGAWVLVRDLLIPSNNVFYAIANGVVFHLLASLALVSHLRTMLTDPGSVPLGNPPGPDTVSYCPFCLCAIPERVYHCTVCRRCIRKNDHHCPWVNNCVGEDNQKYFLLFTLYVGLMSTHVLLLLAIPVLRSHARGEWNASSTVSLPGPIFFLFLVALMGFIFALVMLCSQMCSIYKDKTTTEMLHQNKHSQGRQSMWANIKAICGPRVSLAWLSPFHSPDRYKVSERHVMA